MRKTIDLTGQWFSKLLVLRRARNKPGAWRVRCECGVEKDVAGSNLRRGLSKSCGCSRRGLAHSMPVEYRAYNHAKDRCTNPRNKKYPLYGARGVKFKFTSFAEFLQSVGARPSPEYSLDRFNDGNYGINEVVWSTRSQQRRNQRDMSRPNNARRNIEEIRLHRELGLTQREIAAEFQVSRSFIGELLAA